MQHETIKIYSGLLNLINLTKQQMYSCVAYVTAQLTALEEVRIAPAHHRCLVVQCPHRYFPQTIFSILFLQFSIIVFRVRLDSCLEG